MSLLATLRRLVIALVVLGLFAGSMAYAMPAPMDQMIVAAGQQQDAGMPCGMAAMHETGATGTRIKMPCDTIVPDCVKKMACLQTAALPERWEASIGVATFAVVTYPVSLRLLAGLTQKPELSPPLAA